MVTLCAALAGACSSHHSQPTTSHAPPAPACWEQPGERPTVAPLPATVEERLTHIAIENELRQMHHDVGRYSRGTRPLYSGTLLATDNFGANGGNYKDGVLVPGPVWAILSHEPPHPGAQPADLAELWVVSEGQQKQIKLFQKRADPSITEIAPVTGFQTNAGAIGQCRDCAPVLFDDPARIELREVTARRRFEHVKGKVTISGVLERLPPAAITIDQIIRAHRFDSSGQEAAMSELTRQQGLLIRGVHGRADEPANDVQTRAPPDYSSCDRSAEYSAEWWIDASCLGRFGVRNVVLGPVHTRCCVPYRGMDTPPPCVDLP